MKYIQAYPIKFVSLQTGLKPYLIRSWEKRYKAVCPRRSDSNRRTFSDADIERLKLLKQAVNAGHTISQVARMSDKDLHQLVLQAKPAGSSNRTVVSERHLAGRQSAILQSEKVLERALFYIVRLDAEGLEATLGLAAVELPRHAFLRDVVVPLFEHVGEMWRTGGLKAVNEHLLSVVVRTMLWDMLRTAVTPANAPRIVIATPSGHWHELGALASALVAAESGWRTDYFGPNLPYDEIAYAAAKVKAKAIALGICHGLNEHRLMTELRNLRRTVGQKVPIYLGGVGLNRVRGLADQVDICICRDVDAFRKMLDGKNGELDPAVKAG
jgi:DNA-binding transcriptional MerR regulator